MTLIAFNHVMDRSWQVLDTCKVKEIKSASCGSRNGFGRYDQQIQASIPIRKRCPSEQLQILVPSSPHAQQLLDVEIRARSSGWSCTWCFIQA